VITTPRIPGLELHLPPHTVVTDHDGEVVREISITPIPVDRPPFPLPTGVQVPIYFTIQPGGAYVAVQTYGKGRRGAQLFYPNYRNQPVGTEHFFWHYDPEEKGWHVYGMGEVAAPGRQVVPRPGVALYEFTGAMINDGQSPGPNGGNGPPGADPVDLSTGEFVMEKTDLVVPDDIPLVLTRTYRSADSGQRPFGIGATHPYAVFLWSANQYTEADLILPDGKRIHYVRTSGGTGYADAVFEHTSSPTAFHSSKIVWNGNGWDLTLKDGTVYVFGDSAPLQRIRDRFGNTVTLTWSTTNQFGSGTGKILKVTSPNGRYLEFTYDPSNRITQVKDVLGRTVGYQYDASGRVWKVTDAKGGVTEYTYDIAHRLLTIKDPRNIVYLTNEYDTNGRVDRQTQADSGVFDFSYTLNGSQVTQTELTNPRGYLRRATFNADRFLTLDIEAVGQTVQQTTSYMRLTASNLVESVTDPLGRVTRYQYDAKGNVTSVTRLYGTGDAKTTTFTYEPTYNLLASVTDPLNHTTTFAYDAQGRPTSVTDALGHQTTFTVDGGGQVVGVTNALGQTTTVGYDLGDLVRITTPLGHSKTWLVDVAGRVLRVTDAKGAITKFEYDNLNQVTKITDALTGETTFTYDGNGNLLTLTDSRGKTTTWTYTNMDRVQTRTDPLNRQESFAYDLNGNLTSWTDRKNQITTYTYDALDRHTFAGFGTTGTPPTYQSTIGHTYDAGNRRTQVLDSVAGTITRGYDLLDRLTSETTPEGSIGYTYDGADRRATMTVTGQTGVSYTFDNADRLTGITQATANVTIAYDNADRRTSLTLPNGVVMEYAYDSDSRLTGISFKLATQTLGTLTYGYDARGQRTAVGGTWARTNLPTALTSAIYDNANQIATFGGTPFTYDANGNLTNDGTRNYSWSARNQLMSLSGPVNASFGYDGLARRRNKTVGGTTTQFLYDGLNPSQELAGGSPTANLLTGLGIDEFFTRTDASGARHYLTDALGSSVALTDGTGTVQTEYTYEPFGSVTTTGSTTSNTFAFTGREADETGLSYYRARYYHPQNQRFVGENPLDVQGGSTNLYSYVNNNPTNLLDPLGLWVRNLDPSRPVPVKPEDGPWGKLPPCSEWPGSPDGLLDPGTTAGPPWHKTPGKPWLPDNDVIVTPDGKVDPVSGPATWPWPWPWRYERLPQAPDPTWIPPVDLPDLPGIRPIPGCKPKTSKSEK
jgi:RHS repeat-associated protein